MIKDLIVRLMEEANEEAEWLQCDPDTVAYHILQLGGHQSTLCPELSDRVLEVQKFVWLMRDTLDARAEVEEDCSEHITHCRW
jgi:hypothetical protein